MTTTTYTENQITANRKVWIDALRSGEYAQITGQLREDEFTWDEDAESVNVIGYCCLGVACDLAVKAGVIEDYDGSEGGPDTAVRRWLGLPDDFETDVTEFWSSEDAYNNADKPTVVPASEVPDDAYRSYPITLIGLNDDRKWTFTQIADVIDAGLLDTVVHE